MTYTILNTRTVGEILFTEVEYDFDGTVMTIEIPHFMPQTSEEVITSIVNRAVSEQAKINAIAVLPNVISGLPINQEQSL